MPEMLFVWMFLILLTIEDDRSGTLFRAKGPKKEKLFIFSLSPFFYVKYQSLPWAKVVDSHEREYSQNESWDLLGIVELICENTLAE